MDCKYCGGPTDDPFWDDVCPDCEHEFGHYPHGPFEPNCSYCLSDADDEYEQGYEYMAEDEEEEAHVG